MTKLMTGPEIRSYIRVGKRKLQRLVEEDPSFPVFRIGRDYRAKPSELEAWFEKQKDKKPA